jgi:hypothetical protein
MRAILIDPSTMSVSITEYDGDWKTIAPTIGAASGLFDAVYPTRSLSLFVDDEGLLYEGGNPHGYFQLVLGGNRTGILAGKGLLIGFNQEGESVDCEVPITTVASWVRWVSPRYIRQERDQAAQDHANDI